MGWGGGGTRLSLIPALRKRRQVDLCEFKNSLAFKVSSRTDFKATEKPYLEKQEKRKRKLKKKETFGEHDDDSVSKVLTLKT